MMNRNDLGGNPHGKAVTGGLLGAPTRGKTNRSPAEWLRGSRLLDAKLVGVGLLLVLALPSMARSDTPTKETIRFNVQVDAVGTNGLTIDVKGGTTSSEEGQQAAGGFDHLTVSDPALKENTKKLTEGDAVTLIYSGVGDKKELKAFTIDQIRPGPESVSLVLLTSATICLLFYWLLSGLHPKNLILGEDNRYSNSKFQTALWFAVLITTYVAATILRRWYGGPNLLGNVNIPQNLLLLSGMSAFTFGAAKGITTSKVNDAIAQGKRDPKNSATATPNILRDLTHNDGQTVAFGKPARTPMLDLGDLQMVVVTLLAVSIYLMGVWAFMGSIPKSVMIQLPNVDTTILATFGLGHGAYLAKKALGNVGDS